MRICMLGPLDVRSDAGVSCTVSGVRLARLLIVLAIRPGTVVPATALVEAVWDEAPPGDPAGAVQALVSRLRRAVPGIRIASRAQGYVLDVASDDVDVCRFERLVAEGRSDGDPAASAATLREALSLWRGPALADAGDAPFAQNARVRLDELRIEALQRRIAADVQIGPAAPLVPELEGLVAEHPLREPLIALLMRALDGSGHRSRALAAYEAARRRLDDELGVLPSAELAAEHLRVLRAGDAVPGVPDEGGTPRATGQHVTRDTAGRGTGGTDGTPPWPHTSGEHGIRRSNLRAEISSFVGRDKDVAAVGDLVATERLVTLTGPGGAGKTRLAAHVAAQGSADSPDGPWMIEFAPVTDPADVVGAVLSALGVREAVVLRNRSGGPAIDGIDPLERLLTALSRRRTLLVFDNCEHLIDATASLAVEILATCPGVRIVATSREPLGVAGEQIWPVEPLALPPDDPSMPVDELTTYPSIRLFGERAAAVRPGFAVGPGNAAAVVAICRALDGMPLAIELAAARIRSMTPDQIADRLGDRFAMLAGGNRTALPRHQTLRAVVDWSWDLLDDAERLVWRRLALFSGGASLAAAEAVCAAPGVEVLSAVAALVDKSLLSIRDEEPEPRYVMLETIRAYGLMRLDEAGERDVARAAHAAYFRRATHHAPEGLFGNRQADWLVRLRADNDNLNTAIRNAAARGDRPTALAIIAQIGWFWWLSGQRSEGTDLIADTLDRLGLHSFDSAGIEAGNPATRSYLELLASVYMLGSLLAVEGDHVMSVAIGWIGNSEAILDVLGTPETPVLRMVRPMRVMFRAFEEGWAAENLDVEMPVDDPDPWVAAMARMMRGHVQLNFGRLHDAVEEDFRSALRSFRALGDAWGTSFALISVASIEAWRGEIAEAIADTDQAMGLLDAVGLPADQIGFRTQLARLLWLAGDRRRALRELDAARADGERFGAADAQAFAALTATDFARFDGDLATAAQELRRAETILVSHHSTPQFAALLATARGQLAIARGDLGEARHAHREAVALAASSLDAPVIAQTLVGLADLALAEGRAELAATVLGTSTAIRGVPDHSLIDGVRVAEKSRSLLGHERYETAYARGVASTVPQISQLVGVPMPALAAVEANHT